MQPQVNKEASPDMKGMTDIYFTEWSREEGIASIEETEYNNSPDFEVVTRHTGNCTDTLER